MKLIPKLFAFSGLHNSTINGSSVASGEIPVGGHILVKEGHQLQRSRFIPPVPHQVAYDGKHGDNMNASGAHTIICIVSNALVERTRCVSIRPYGITFLPQGKGKECGTDIRHNTRKNDLFLASFFKSLTEISIIPRVNFTISLDEGRLWMHFDDFLGEWSIRACLCTSSQNRGQIEDFSNGSMGKDVVLVLVGRKVAYQLEQTNLVVNYEQNSVVFVEAFESKLVAGSHRGPRRCAVKLVEDSCRFYMFLRLGIEVADGANRCTITD